MFFVVFLTDISNNFCKKKSILVVSSFQAWTSQCEQSKYVKAYFSMKPNPKLDRIIAIPKTVNRVVREVAIFACVCCVDEE